jgi:carbamoyltransferase
MKRRPDDADEGYEVETVAVMEYPHKIELIVKNHGNNYGGFWADENTVFDDTVSFTKAYEAVSQYLGFGFIEAGKTMGLASYGTTDSSIPALFKGNRGSKDVFIPYYPAGAFIDQVRNPSLQQKEDPKEWHTDPSKLPDVAKNLAYAIQKETQERILQLIETSVKATGIKNVVLVGGYALNCVANYFYKKNIEDINLYVEPIAHDGGTAIGAAKLFSRIHSQSTEIDKQTSLYYGINYNSFDKTKINSEEFNVEEVQADRVAELLANRKIVSLFQGGAEAGPRALGNRSILYDPRDPNGKEYVNRVKGREWFRPFAGTVLKEHASEWFDMAGLEESPFMMYAVDVLPHRVIEIPAITHVDNTCRVQTVTREQNKVYYDIIEKFYSLTNVPIIFNTSFNLAGEPLVETVEDALDTLKRSEIDYLYLADYNLLVSRVPE